MTLLQDIKNANHIVIEFDVEFVASACALYTYVLQQHKKVSLVCGDDIDSKFSFLPWFDKIRKSGYSSADLVLPLNISALDLYEIFEKNSIKLNQKMATAFYAGLLVETKGFSANLDGTIFATAKQLIDAKAEYKTCTKFILNTKSLAYMRLKALMFNKMLLKDDATLVVIDLSEDDLSKSGAKLSDAFEILEESLSLVHVKKAELFKYENNEILKSITKEI